MSRGDSFIVFAFRSRGHFREPVGEKQDPIAGSQNVLARLECRFLKNELGRFILVFCNSPAFTMFYACGL